MAPPQQIAQPNRRIPRLCRRPRISVLLVVIGGLTLLSLGLFAREFPGLQKLTSLPPFGASQNSDVSSISTTTQEVLTATNHQQRAPMQYGTHSPPAFANSPPKLIGDLPKEHIPAYTPPSAPTEEPGGGGGGGGGENRTGGKRLVVVGDVHGHSAALRALLDKIGFDNRNGDHLVLAGDMVTKGPDSPGVIQLAMDLGASAVRGNQDDRVIAAVREKDWGLDPEERARLGVLDGEDEDGDGHVDTERRKRDEAKRIARRLLPHQMVWLKSLPIILRIGQLPDAVSPPWNADTLVVVHGGLVPGVPLEKQDAWAVMNMRSLVYPGHGKGKGKGRKGKGKEKGKHHHAQNKASDHDEEEDGDDEEVEEVAPDAVAVPIDGHDGEPWSHAWNRYQNLLPPTSPHTLAIYGHDAKAGLQVNPRVDISPWTASSSSSFSSTNKNKHKPDSNSRKHTPNKDKKPKQKGLRYAFGLDSGCGHNRRLTALVIEAGPVGVSHRIVQVDCVPRVRSKEEGQEEGEEQKKIADEEIDG
ncbi:hypothetical protein VTI74DRAFT_9835 [Chaetomium olivicolor]